MGRDGFVLARDVVSALRGSGLEIAEQPPRNLGCGTLERPRYCAPPAYAVYTSYAADRSNSSSSLKRIIARSSST